MKINQKLKVPSTRRYGAGKSQKYALRGQSVIEVIVAVAILVIIAASSVVAILGSFSTTRLAEEETKASLFASEGLEAVQSIRNQDWANLTTGTHGLTSFGNIWAFSGTSDDPDGLAKFTRAITIATVQRDGDGDIIASGGTADPDTMDITSTVTWNFTPTRNNSVVMQMYLTNWQKGKGVGGAGGGTFTTCADYCISVGYVTGTCRQNAQQCTNNSEDYKPTGDQYCTGGANADTCCCGN